MLQFCERRNMDRCVFTKRNTNTEHVLESVCVCDSAKQTPTNPVVANISSAEIRRQARACMTDAANIDVLRGEDAVRIEARAAWLRAHMRIDELS